MIVMPADPRVDRKRYVTKRDLAKYGYARGSSMHAIGSRHAQREGSSRRQIGELMTQDEDQRQGERVSSRAVPEAEVLPLPLFPPLSLPHPQTHTLPFIPSSLSPPPPPPSHRHSHHDPSISQVSRGWIPKFEFESK